jgi:hypothetical protein
VDGRDAAAASDELVMELLPFVPGKVLLDFVVVPPLHFLGAGTSAQAGKVG